MTIEIAEFRCPTCGHTMGEEEYKHACNEFDRNVAAKCDELMEKLNNIHEKEMYEQNRKYIELENRIDQEVEFQTNKRLSEQEEKSEIEKAGIKEVYEHKLKIKDEEIEATKLQSATYIDEKIEEGRKQNEENHRLKEMEYKLHISRIEKENEKMQKTLENVPPEFKGTAGEMKLFDDLHTAFQQDDLMPKSVGVEMPDVIQTITMQSGERIRTPIVWDMKTGENITAKDIEKAKRYKEKYNTDYCIVVSAKGITAKDSKNFRTGLIGEREGILLVNPKLAIPVAELTRNFVIEKTKLIKNSNGRTSKEKKLYEYITSSARLRKVQEKIEKKLKLDELQRKEEARAKKTWNERKNLIQDWFELDRDDQETIDSMIDKEEVDEEEDVSSKDEKEDVT